MIQPIDQLLAGGADASGNFTSSQLLPVPTLWGALKVVAQTTGTARWAIFIAGAPKAFGRGERVDLPILVQPAQSVQVIVTGASPNAPLTGVITGVGGTTLDEIAPYISLVPNTIALDTSSPQLDLGAVTGTAGPGGTRTFLIPPNTYALAILPGGGATFFTSLNVQGIQSLDTYANINPIAGGLATDVIYVPLGTQAFDTQVKVAGSVSGAGTATMEVVALLTPIAIAASITGVGVTPIVSGGQDVANPAQASIPIVPAQFYNPARWQAAGTTIGGHIVAPGIGNDFTIIPAVAGQIISLFDMVFDTNSAAAVDLSLWDGASANNINKGRLRQRGTTTPMRFNGSGGSLTSGNALIGKLDAGDVGSDVWFAVARSQT